MDFRQLQYILKVAQVGNITRAAEELYMTQPALSHFISKVEKEEGIKLFDRSTTPVTLTYAGERYVDTIRRIMELNQQLKEEIAEISTLQKGRLIIGIPPARAAELLPRVLPEYLRRYPGITVQTVEHNSRQLREDVRQGRVDFAILPKLDGFEDFRCETLFEEELFLVTQAGKLPATDWKQDESGERVVDLATLKDERFILLKNGHGMRNALDALFSYHGFKPQIAMETTNNETAYGLASTGMGVAVVPRMTLDSQRNPHPTDVFRLSKAGMKWQVVAVFNAEAVEPVLAVRCVALIREIYGIS